MPDIKKEKETPRFPKVENADDLIDGLTYALNITLNILVTKIDQKELDGKNLAQMTLSTYLSQTGMAYGRGVRDFPLINDIANEELKDVFSKTPLHHEK